MRYSDMVQAKPDMPAKAKNKRDLAVHTVPDCSIPCLFGIFHRVWSDYDLSACAPNVLDI